METIALAGNPNCGKTTLFNHLTGQKAHVGNWPGITVERREGVLKNVKAALLDLPGLYSMTVFTPEELAARDALLEGRKVLNLLDGATIDRGLYLTLQLMELGIPLFVVVRNTSSQDLNLPALSKALGVPVRDAADPDLQEALIKEQKNALPVRYSRLLEGYVTEAVSVLAQNPPEQGSLRFWALAALEGSPPECTREQQFRLEGIRARLEKRVGKEADSYIASERYRVIETILASARPQTPVPQKEPADRLLLHRIFAIPCFLFIMGGLFWICFGTPGQALSHVAEAFLQVFSISLSGLLTGWGVSQPLGALICEGILGGVGTVLCFLPQLALLFLGMSFLEECGYLARAAFLTDWLLRRVGLSGRAFVPLLMGFGCTTTAVLSTRTLRGEERRRAIQLTPFCSCGAKFPIYALFIGTFFPEHMGIGITGCYVIGIAAGILRARRMGGHRLKTDFLLELPGYQCPTVKGLWRGVRERCGDFLKKAGTVIFLMSIAVWVCGHVALQPALRFAQPEQSLLYVMADKMIPFLTPLGFACRESAVALLTGIAGKEAVVSSLGVLCGTGGSFPALQSVLHTLFTPLSAISFLSFCALYTPCLSALTAIGKELSPRDACAVAFRQTAFAYLVSFLIYQGGTLLFSFLA